MTQKKIRSLGTAGENPGIVGEIWGNIHQNQESETELDIPGLRRRVLDTTGLLGLLAQHLRSLLFLMISI